MNKYSLTGALMLCLTAGGAAIAAGETVTDDVIEGQRSELAKNTEGKGFGPQSPRDIDNPTGLNARAFGKAPERQQMNLCDIHFHENAEHRGGQFTRFAGNGDGKGTGTGFVFNGELTEAELTPLANPIGITKYGDLQSGDTVEVHFVHSTAQAYPGPTLGTCLSDSIGNPQLRVEAQVIVLVNDPNAIDFREMARIDTASGLYQAPGIPEDTGTPVTYAGSTTGPSFNSKASPFQVTWNVRPGVAKVDINSMAAWLEGNVFNETGAHGVRNLVTNPRLLSPITQ